MASFIVMEPGGTDRLEAATEARLVRDGFSWPAFMFPPFWLLWNRLFAEGAVVFAIMFGLTAAAAKLGPAASFISFLLSLYTGFEGSSLLLGALRRRGWREWGVVNASDQDEAEIRYLAQFAANAGTQEQADVEKPRQPSPVIHRPSGPALGLLSYPGA